MKQIEMKHVIKQAAQGDKESVAALYNTYREKLYFFVIKNVDNKDIAEDIIEDTFLSAIQDLNKLKDISKFESWIFSIAYNKCKMYYRQKEQDLNIKIDDENFAIESIEDETIMLPDNYTINKEFKSNLKNIINNLKRDSKSAVILYYYNNLSIKDIAKSLDISETSVKKKLQRARAKIKKEIESLYGSENFAAVPFGLMLRNSISDKYASSVLSAPTVCGSSIVLKTIGIAATAGVAIGVPVALGIGENSNFGIYENDSSDFVMVSSYYDNSSEQERDSFIDTSSDTSDTNSKHISGSTSDDESNGSYDDNMPYNNDSSVKELENSSEKSLETESSDVTQKESIDTLTAEKLIGMPLSDALALGNNNYEMVYPTGVQNGRNTMYKCADFPQYCFKSTNENGLIDVINLYKGAIINDNIYLGMSYNELCDAVGEELLVGMSNTDLEYSTSAVIDGTMWVFSFDLSDEQKEEIHKRLESQADDLQTFELDPYAYSVSIADINPDTFSAVNN